MAAPKVFITGATGYVGGDALFALTEAHPDWDYTCLVRSSQKGANLVARYPKIRLVYGELSSAEMITEESRNADIVLRTDFASSDDETSANAIAAGLSLRSSPGYWIHTSGTGILLYADLDIKSFGQPSSKVWDDVDDISAINDIPDHALHRNVDKIVLAAGSGESSAVVKTAIVCPPTIYGVGRGTGNTRSIQVPMLTRHILQRKQAFMVEEGKSLWPNVHVHDLSDLYISLAEQAVKPEGGAASWGTSGYFFSENGEHVWGDISKELANRAHALKLLPTKDVESLPEPEVSSMVGFPYGAMLWGANARSKASRARKELGWAPKAVSLEDTLDEAIRVEATSLGFLKGHAAVAAGE